LLLQEAWRERFLKLVDSVCTRIYRSRSIEYNSRKSRDAQPEFGFS
jgi:hypothetical protein